MAIYVIGDIQGCYTEFEHLLELIEFDQKKDQLWLVGDLVNRAPESLAVLRRVKSLGDAAITVLGNHVCICWPSPQAWPSGAVAIRWMRFCMRQTAMLCHFIFQCQKMTWRNLNGISAQAR